MKRLILSCLILGLSSATYAEVVCTGSGEYQQCMNMPSEDPLTCNAEENKILEHTGALDEPMSCDNKSLLGEDGKSKEEVAEAKKEYEKLCKKKAKAYKKALMKNLMSKGKVGQWVQALFKKKKYKTKIDGTKNKDRNQNIAINPDELEGKSEKEIEDYILSELEKASGVKDLKAKALAAQEKPAFKLGYHESETVPLNVMVQTKGKKACKVEVADLGKLPETPIKKCEFCVEKNITGSFTNDCSYMVNKNQSEKDSLALVGASKVTDYCNHSMDGVENDLSEVENMSNQLCDIAKSGMRPDFKIETSRNLYKDKTVDLAKKRGEFIQKYIRKNLMDPSKCDLGEDAPDWLTNESEFNKAVKVTHPYYENGATGDYGPSPYASTPSEQEKNIKDLSATLQKEKADLQAKQAQAQKEKQESDAEIAVLQKEIAGLRNDYNKMKTSLQSVKSIDPQIFEMKEKLENIANLIQDKNTHINNIRQKSSDTQNQQAGYAARLQTIDGENSKKIELLKNFYAEKNGTVTPAKSTEEWDKLLFNDFKMVRISGKAVEDPIIPGVDPKYMTPAVNIALNALVDVDNFTCVVEPITTTKVTVGGVLKFPLKVAMVLTTPVIAVGATVGSIAVAPITTVGSFLCEGCGNPGNIPPVLRIGNVRTLDLSKGSRAAAWADVKSAFHAYTSWGGLLDVDADKYSTEWSTEQVWQEEQERLAKKNK